VQVHEAGTLRIRVEGEVIAPGKLAIRDLTKLGESIQAGVDRLARLMGHDIPTARLRRATELLLTGIEPGSATLVLELRPSPDGEEMTEERLFRPPPLDVGLRAMERFVAGLHELEEGSERVPEGWDTSVMEVAEELAELSTSRHIEVSLDVAIPSSAPRRARIAPELAPRFAVRHAPSRRRRTASGELIAVDLRKGRIDVEDATGRRVQCRFDPETTELMDRVKRLVGRVVLVSGQEELDIATKKVGKLEVETLEETGVVVPLHEMFWQRRSAAEQAREQGAEPLGSIAEVSATETFTSEELEAFSQALRELRRQG